MIKVTRLSTATSATSGNILESALHRLTLADPLADARVYPLDEAAATLNMPMRTLRSYCTSGEGHCTMNGAKWGMTRPQMIRLNEANTQATQRRREMTDLEAAIEMTRTRAPSTADAGTDERPLRVEAGARWCLVQVVSFEVELQVRESLQYQREALADQLPSFVDVHQAHLVVSRLHPLASL